MLYPYNSVIQLWFELGLVGIVLVSCLITLLFRFLQNVPLQQARFIYAQIVTIFVMSLSAFGFWQTWWLVLLWIAAYLSKTTVLLK